MVSEAEWETIALERLSEHGWEAIHGQQVAHGTEPLGRRFRKFANQLARSWALAAGNDTLADLRSAARFYEEVRVWMGKFNAQERQASGDPVPEEIQRLLSTLVASSTTTARSSTSTTLRACPSRRCPNSGPSSSSRRRRPRTRTSRSRRCATC